RPRGTRGSRHALRHGQDTPDREARTGRAADRQAPAEIFEALPHAFQAVAWRELPTAAVVLSGDGEPAVFVAHLDHELTRASMSEGVGDDFLHAPDDRFRPGGIRDREFGRQAQLNPQALHARYQGLE